MWHVIFYQICYLFSCHRRVARDILPNMLSFQLPQACGTWYFTKYVIFSVATGVWHVIFYQICYLFSCHRRVARDILPNMLSFQLPQACGTWYFTKYVIYSVDTGVWHVIFYQICYLFSWHRRLIVSSFYNFDKFRRPRHHFQIHFVAHFFVKV